MVTETTSVPFAGRRISRLSAHASLAQATWPLPPDGLCLSSFVLLSSDAKRSDVLVGRLDPSAPWDRIGALDPRRIELNAPGWMLPSCHLIYYESPEAAARRVLREQLGLGDVPLDPPLVFSEMYVPRRHPDLGEHWDIEFVFRATLASAPRSHPAWRELRFVDPRSTPRESFTRSHDEVLELVGYRFG